MVAYCYWFDSNDPDQVAAIVSSHDSLREGFENLPWCVACEHGTRRRIPATGIQALVAQLVERRTRNA